MRRLLRSKTTQQKQSQRFALQELLKQFLIALLPTTAFFDKIFPIIKKQPHLSARLFSGFHHILNDSIIIKI